MAREHYEDRAMTKESRTVFSRLAVAFVAAFVLMVGLNRLTSASVSQAESLWATFIPTATDVHDGRRIMDRNGCFSCHSIDGFGGNVGSRLNGVAKRKSREDLFKWIQSPYSVKPTTRMPQYHLSDEEILQILSYLETKDSMKVKG